MVRQRVLIRTKTSAVCAKLYSATGFLGYCLRLRPFRHIDLSFFPSGSGGPSALRIVSHPAVLQKKRTAVVLTLSSTLQAQNQQIKGVIRRQTNQGELDRSVEVPFRLGRERNCGQDVCAETDVWARGRLGLACECKVSP